VDFFSSALIGVFLGFVFGVGCALAVMYSIFMGGYRAAIKDAQLLSPPQRLLAARAKYLPTTPPTPPND
jgi:ABC-type antimicrobial peptide transport system permease subunit